MTRGRFMNRPYIIDWKIFAFCGSDHESSTIRMRTDKYRTVHEFGEAQCASN